MTRSKTTRNSLLKLINNNGNSINTRHDLEIKAVKYYDELFKEESRTKLTLPWFPKIIAPEMNEWLMNMPPIEKIKATVMGMKAGTKPGTDGINIDFYRKY